MVTTVTERVGDHANNTSTGHSSALTDAGGDGPCQVPKDPGPDRCCMDLSGLPLLDRPPDNRNELNVPCNGVGGQGVRYPRIGSGNHNFPGTELAGTVPGRGPTSMEGATAGHQNPTHPVANRTWKGQHQATYAAIQTGLLAQAMAHSTRTDPDGLDESQKAWYLHSCSGGQACDQIEGHDVGAGSAARHATPIMNRDDAEPSLMGMDKSPKAHRRWNNVGPTAASRANRSVAPDGKLPDTDDVRDNGGTCHNPSEIQEQAKANTLTTNEPVRMGRCAELRRR